MLVELWTSRLILRLEACRISSQTRWTPHSTRSGKLGSAVGLRTALQRKPKTCHRPSKPSVPRLSGLPLSVADDVGTRYHFIGRATGGSEHPWRSEWRLEPGAPSSASVLRIALEDGEPEKERLELALPSRT